MVMRLYLQFTVRKYLQTLQLLTTLTFLCLAGHCSGCNSSNRVCGDRSSLTTMLYGGGDSTKYDGSGSDGWYDVSKK